MVKLCLTSQYRAALKMLRMAIENCSDELWAGGEHPRATWRIVYHALFYTDLYMQQSEANFKAPSFHVWHANLLWVDKVKGPPPVETTYSRELMISYLDDIDSRVEATISALDLDATDSGFNWYPEIGKLDHVMMALRHLSIHLGQVLDRIYQHGGNVNWVSRAE
jgi:hypothetical protein